MSCLEKVTGIILAGGKSSRMGRDKALLSVGNATNIERIKKELESFSSEIVIAANDQQPYAFLNVKIIGDVYEEKGPLAGLHACLEQSKTEWNFFAACDLPFFSQKIADYMVSKTKHEGIEGVVPSVNGRVHPLYALYKTSAAPAFERQLKRNQLKIREALNQILIYYVSKNELIDAGFSNEEIERAFYNMNHPEEFEWVTKQFD